MSTGTRIRRAPSKRVTHQIGPANPVRQISALDPGGQIKFYQHHGEHFGSQREAVSGPRRRSNISVIVFSLRSVSELQAASVRRPVSLLHLEFADRRLQVGGSRCRAELSGIHHDGRGRRLRGSCRVSSCICMCLL